MSIKTNRSFKNSENESIQPMLLGLGSRFFSETFLILLGLVLMFGSFGWFFIGGNVLRYVFLLLGFVLLILVSLKRQQWRLLRHAGFIALSVATFAVLLVIMYLREHVFSYQALVFQCVVFALFVSGGLLGARAQLNKIELTFSQSALLIAFVVPGMLGFLRYAEQLAFYGASRDFGSIELNPVGLAYATSVLCVVMLFGVFVGRNWIVKSIFGGASLVVFFALASSASRGAFVFLLVTIFVVVFALLLKKQLSWSRAFFILLLLPLAGFLTLYIFAGQWHFLERFDILFNRLVSTYNYLIGESSRDMATEARFVNQKFYLLNWRDWFLFGTFGYVGYPHNQFIEWAARFGLIGTSIGVFFFVVFVRTIKIFIFSARRVPQEIFLFFPLLLFSYLQSMTSLSLDMNRALFFAMGYFVGYFLLKKGSSSRIPKKV